MNKNKLSQLKSYATSGRILQDKRAIVFLICIGLSTGLWFLNALSKNYTTSITYPVKYVNIPDGKLLANTPPSHFDLKVNAHGFTLLRHKLNLTFTPIIVNLNRLAIDSPTSASGSGIVVSSGRLINNVSSQVSNEINILEILPSTFIIEFDKLFTKEVPVKPQIDFSLKPQYNLASEIRVNPKTVTIEGPGLILDTINFVSTEIKSFKELSKSKTENFDLIIPAQTSVEPEKVKVEIPIEEFTEKELMVPIQVSGKPDSVTIKLFPAQAKVSFMVGLSHYAKSGSKDLTLSVSYSDILENKPVLDINVEVLPEFIYDLKYSPQTIEYLIEEK